MSDFTLLKASLGKYVIMAPRRAERPDDSSIFTPQCPFCIGNEAVEKDVYRIGGVNGDSNWEVRVIANKFPFAPYHEIIIHSPDHHKNIDELPYDQVRILFEVFQNRFNHHQGKGAVFIFHNHGELGGESIPHPHSQLITLPSEIKFELPAFDFFGDNAIEKKGYMIFVPPAPLWPDEVWIAPKVNDKTFGQISHSERDAAALILQHLLQIYTIRHGHEFPFNFYIYPWKNWYIRIIPREKKLGGLEVVSNIFVNITSPQETMSFIREQIKI